MKRKFLIGILAVLFCVFLTVTLTRKAALSQLPSCTVVYDKLISEYTFSCEARGQRHYHYFDGYITSLEKQPGEWVNKDDVILKYTDSRGRSVSLKAVCDGLLLEASGSPIVIEDEQLKLYGTVPLEKYQLMKIGQQGSFRQQGRVFLTEIEEMGALPQGSRKNWQLVLSVDEQAGLLSGQKVNVLMPLEQLYGLCVDRMALLADEDGYFLLDSAALNDLANWRNYRISVEVICQSQQKALVQGIQLENREVLILSEPYRQVLIDAD
jgi:hypothetical protein